MMHRTLVLTTSIAVAALLAACGGGGDDASGGGARTVGVDMVDIAFEPDALEVARGETVRFVFTNTGDVAHDAFIGDEEAQAEHEAEMRESDGEGDHDGGHGDEEDAITVAPGDAGELTYTFDDAGTFEVGCHQPGHYAAGMKMVIEVS